MKIAQAMLSVDLEKNLTEAWLVGAAVRCEEHDETGNRTTGRLSAATILQTALPFEVQLQPAFVRLRCNKAYTAFTTTIDGSGSL